MGGRHGNDLPANQTLGVQTGSAPETKGQTIHPPPPAVGRGLRLHNQDGWGKGWSTAESGFRGVRSFCV